MGDPKGPFKKTITLPNNGEEILAYHHEENGLRSPSANKIRISKFPAISEVEPNNSFSNATKTELSIPLAFDGVIQEDGDIDCFRFQAKKGDRYYIKAHARSVASPSIRFLIYTTETESQSVEMMMPATVPDSLITQTFPRDGEYILRITDHLGKGSPLHAYRIETEKLGT